MTDERVPLEGSSPSRPAALQNCADPPRTQRVNATILVRRRTPAGTQSQLDAILRGAAPPLSREQAAQTLGADARDIAAVTKFAEAYGLEVIEASAPERSVKVSATVDQMEAAFGTKLRACNIGGQAYLCYEDALTVPSSLAAVIEGVLGLDQRPIADTR